MKKIILPIIMSVGFSLSGCAPDLGDFKYLAKEPKVRATILSSKIEAASSEYTSPTLKVSGVAQEIDPFPVKHYFLRMTYEASFGGDKKYESNVSVEMIEGKGLFDDSIYLSDMPAGA